MRDLDGPQARFECLDRLDTAFAKRARADEQSAIVIFQCTRDDLGRRRT